MAAKDWLGDTSLGVARTVRPQQIEMAETVEKVFAEGGIAMIEAGTGVGKSYGYLAPAIESGLRVVVSTAKKTLQSQLAEKDLPFLSSKIPWPPLSNGAPLPTPVYSILKGKSNYVCKLALRDFEGKTSNGFNADHVKQFIAWAEHDEFGDVGSYPFPAPFDYLVKVQECVGRRCEHYSTCGYRRLRDYARTSRILVVNHALLAYDLQLGAGKILGPYDALVIDEAHEFREYARDAFSLRLHAKQGERMAKLLEDHERVIVPDGLDHAYQDLFASVNKQGLFRLDDISAERLDELRDLLFEMKAQFSKSGVNVDDSGLQGEEGEDIKMMTPDEARQHAKALAAATITARSIKAIKVLFGDHLKDAAALGKEPIDYIQYVESKGRGPHTTMEIVVTPVEIGPMIAPPLLGVKKVVITSATLATSGHFNLMSREFGLSSSQITHQKVLGSPFPYNKISALYIATEGKKAEYGKKEEFFVQQARDVHELLQASQGGGFVLCASYEDMNGIYNELRAADSPRYEIIKQDVNVDQMVAWFKASPRRVLIGVKSLWAGVDVPGLGLRTVIIPRLPFPSPQNVVLAARKEKYIDRKVRDGASRDSLGYKVFTEFDIQEMLIELKQGAGRLIRTETDMGIVAILDPRAAYSNKAYAGSIRSALPHPFTYDKNSAIAVLQALGNRATAP